MSSSVTVRFFAGAREAVGRPTVRVAVPREGSRVADVIDGLSKRYPLLGRALKGCRYFRNGTLVAGPAEGLRPGDELAVHPPYGGG